MGWALKGIGRGLLSGLLGAFLCAAPGSFAHACSIPAAGQDVVVTTNSIPLSVHVSGGGEPVLFIPSIGRDVSDYHDLAARVAAAGFLTIEPTPRGIRANLGSLALAGIEDLAGDALTVAKALCGDEPVNLVGQAFGSRIARLAAAKDSAHVARLILLGPDDGQPVSDELRAAMSNAVAQGIRSTKSRLEGLQTAFFAKGNDATVWMEGWYPLVAAAQNRAGKRTDVSAWLTGGTGPVLLVQGEKDPVQTPEAGQALQALMGARAQLVIIPQASHALLPEQPDALAAVVLAFLKGDNPVDPALIDPLIRNHQGKFAECRIGDGDGTASSCRGAMDSLLPRG